MSVNENVILGTPFLVNFKVRRSRPDPVQGASVGRRRKRDIGATGNFPQPDKAGIPINEVADGPLSAAGRRGKGGNGA